MLETTRGFGGRVNMVMLIRMVTEGSCWNSFATTPYATSTLKFAQVFLVQRFAWSTVTNRLLYCFRCLFQSMLDIRVKKGAKLSTDNHLVVRKFLA